MNVQTSISEKEGDLKFYCREHVLETSKQRYHAKNNTFYIQKYIRLRGFIILTGCRVENTIVTNNSLAFAINTEVQRFKI